MSMLKKLSAAVVFVVLCSAVYAQPKSADVPRLIRYGGTLTNMDGSPRIGTVGVTFSIYADSSSTAPLYQEVQNVVVDAEGHYSVLLGAARPEGLPDGLFAANDARWLGIRIESEQEQPRAILAAVPYALKAADAETLGGKPLSAFVLNENNGRAAGTDGKAKGAASGTLGVMPLSINTAGSSGTQNQVAKWTDNAGTLGNSIITDTGTFVGINATNPLSMLQVGSVTSGTGESAAPGILQIQSYADLNSAQSGLEFKGSAWGSGFGWKVVTPDRLNGNTPLSFAYRNNSAGWTEVVTFRSDTARVGIGTTSPAQKLDVNGNINASGNLAGVNVTASGVITGNGSGLTSLSTSALSGTLASTNLSGTYSSAVTFSNASNSFSGSGSGLTNLSASALSGTLASANLSGTYSNALTFSNASNSFTGSGLGLTNVAAAKIGAVPSATANIRLITYLGGCDNCAVLTPSDNQGMIYQNLIGAPLTIQSITCYSDVGAPSIDIQRDNGSTANVTSSPIGCSTGGTTVSSFSVGTLNNNEKFNFLMSLPDSTAHRVTVIIKTTL